ncbi:Short C-terminal domain-containing protein [Novosphingobium sp. CF614]|uniref:SHOCT domain-containing protein n=1 Tax=Novosphingobium sp. CF614 TaxID=1884364 RepID=UPI0008EC8623|nr:SHOCT domain-containing protein [Novosphingobium sp. CF614]SFG08865.1 Short C-terminal domain-containing protein [Novosphingobium sp. CF614]
MKAIGTNGEIELFDQVLVIRKRGLGTLILQGFKGDKRIPYTSIAAIQLRRPSLLTAGYFQITLPGGIEGRGGIIDATKDENTVMFAKKQIGAFEMVQREIESRLAASRQSSSITPSAPDTDPLTAIRKLGELREAGMISEGEFEAKKAELLSRI